MSPRWPSPPTARRRGGSGEVPACPGPEACGFLPPCLSGLCLRQLGPLLLPAARGLRKLYYVCCCFLLEASAGLASDLGSHCNPHGSRARVELLLCAGHLGVSVLTACGVGTVTPSRGGGKPGSAGPSARPRTTWLAGDRVVPSLAPPGTHAPIVSGGPLCARRPPRTPRA